MTGRVVVYVINMYLILTAMVSLVDGCSTTAKAPVRAPVPVVSPGR